MSFDPAAWMASLHWLRQQWLWALLALPLFLWWWRARHHHRNSGSASSAHNHC